MFSPKLVPKESGWLRLPAARRVTLQAALSMIQRGPAAPQPLDGMLSSQHGPAPALWLQVCPWGAKRAGRCHPPTAKPGGGAGPSQPCVIPARRRVRVRVTGWLWAAFSPSVPPGQGGREGRGGHCAVVPVWGVTAALLGPPTNPKTKSDPSVCWFQ